uniref:Protein kinase domain-containing protein n=1 Tax=Alexandrium monilatum TaxID=311494 RepID=A0A7S4WB29_9DINO
MYPESKTMAPLAPRAPITLSKPSQPPSQCRFFARRRTSAQAASAPAKTAEEASSEDPVAVSRRHVVHALSGLARQLCVLLAQPEMDCEELQRLNFSCIRTREQFVRSYHEEPEFLSEVECVLVLNVGRAFHAALDCFRLLDELPSVPPSIAVLLFPGEQRTEALEEECELIRDFFELGADDVIILPGSQTLTRHRMQTAILRSELTASKAAEVMAREAARVTKRQSRSLRALSRRYLWELPGAVLQGIPPVDDKSVDGGDSTKVGGYQLTSRLGAGSFGAVFKVGHPKHGDRALKVLEKDSMKTVCQLFAVNRELSIMLNIAPHPNIVQAFEAFHTPSSIALVMEYSGELNLRSFTLKALKGSGEKVLPCDTVFRFSRQAAAGLAHLHYFRVCHRDLKPKNFVISNEGTVLKLTDFGLSCLSFGPHQRLLHMCGSLPFIAPEVLSLQHDWQVDVGGYDGFAADVWSLGVNFVELVHGMYTIERLLGWAPQPPLDVKQQLRDLECFPSVWQSTPKMHVPRLQTIVDSIFVLQPDRRCTIEWIVGSDGLCIDGADQCPFHRCSSVSPRGER